MKAQEAYEKFNEMTLESALNVVVPFGKFQGKKVSEISFGYAEWVLENIQAASATEEKFQFLYAVSAFMKSDSAILPDSQNEVLANCMKSQVKK